MSLRFCGALLGGLLALSGCGLLPGDDETADPTPPAAVAPDLGAPLTPTAPEVPVGLPIQSFELATGQCFNRYDDEVTEAGAAAGSRTTIVDCASPHGNEVIAELTHPALAAEPFPGTSALNEWGQAECYKVFPSYLGIDYELSAYEIGQFVPTEDQWIQGSYRTVHCYVYLPGDDGAVDTTGTARNIAR